MLFDILVPLARTIREEYPDFLEDMRRLSIWTIVETRQRQLGEDPRHAIAESKKIMKKYDGLDTEVRGIIQEWASFRRQEFIDNQVDGIPIDGTGDLMIKMLLESIEERDQIRETAGGDREIESRLVDDQQLVNWDKLL